ncbi:uncharacterized protein TRIREDRAFT_111109 [Trichoderma reesei QM6a]|uniref:Predicted protein n=2 Tax=Hypocrea jecorina TaxID=51453 RepID=G0RTS2_HYPJQ|nr:uncharacterized protein TRIREDRAFT_111109 [Trichoderma reesei QM6a]EGR45484.1 predicted protein [Trichoderma reesei QM6a]ETR98649.1 hypothetical protein M419DRAFT_133327 [Trichoderma reesei RUT C-30]
MYRSRHRDPRSSATYARACGVPSAEDGHHNYRGVPVYERDGEYTTVLSSIRIMSNDQTSQANPPAILGPLRPARGFYMQDEPHQIWESIMDLQINSHEQIRVSEPIPCAYIFGQRVSCSDALRQACVTAPHKTVMLLNCV